MKTLLAEDDFINRRVMQLLFAGYGKCDVAENGRTALEMYVEAHKSHKPYAFVCIDGSLPEMDGLAVLKEIRSYEHEHFLLGKLGASILYLSPDSNKETILKAFRAQCDGLIFKPFKKRELVNFIIEQGLATEKSII